MNIKSTVFRSIALLGVLAAPLAAHAFPIVYTVSGVASGSLGTTSFTNSAVTLTESSDTTSVVSNYFNFSGLRTVTIAGVGTATFTSANLAVADDQGSPGAAFFDSVTRFVFGTQASVFSTYTLQAALGPITGPYFVNPSAAEATSSGNLVLSSVSGNTTFTAVGSPSAVTPEPGTLTLLSTGVLTMVGFARRKLLRA